MDILPILKTWSKVECVRFAVWCARGIQHLNPDHRVSAGIEAAETWLRDPSQANRVAADAAAANAYAAAYAAYTAAARAANADAANADAAYAAAYAAYNAAAAAAAAHAAYTAYTAAAHACGHAGVTNYDLLQAYIGDQLLNAANT